MHLRTHLAPKLAPLLLGICVLAGCGDERLDRTDSHNFNMAVLEVMSYTISGEATSSTDKAADLLIQVCRDNPDAKPDSGDKTVFQELQDLDAPGDVGERISRVVESGCR